MRVEAGLRVGRRAWRAGEGDRRGSESLQCGCGEEAEPPVSWTPRARGLGSCRKEEENSAAGEEEKEEEVGFLPGQPQTLQSG